MTPEEMTKIAFQFSNEFEEIYTQYLISMGKQLKEIGTLKPSNIHRLEQIAKYGGNIVVINNKIAKTANMTVSQLTELYKQLVENEYSYAKKLYDYKNIKQVPLKYNKDLQEMIEAMSKVTSNTFKNLSNTTALSESYKKAVDKAVISAKTGISTYDKEIRHIINNALNGSKITYESGYRRRLDSAVRMNVLEGMRQVNIETRRIMGEQFGADGIEISAHALCAPDHIPIQGRQFTNQDFEELNASLVRPIGTLNCKHFTFPIIMEISEPAVSEKTLKEYETYSQMEFDIDGKQYTRYECSQLMRNIETETRYAKEKAILSRETGFTDGEKEAKQRIKELRYKYNDIANKTKLEPRIERMYVPNYIKR